ncbi:MAG: hypothetical protein KatS3mg109_1103 [Pirellulaceae bacterium]|nr:MAG: hypothetical protein KatS3mg109_1103 [Pirellulaceae bacterium]
MLVSVAPSLLVQYYVHQARLRLLDRDYSSAQNLLNRAERWQPRNGPVAFYQARIYRRLGRESEFARYLEEAERRGFSAEQAQQEWQLWNAQQGQLALVEPYIGKLLARPGYELPDVCEAFARGFLMTFRLADARRMFETWEQAWPSDPLLYVLRARLWGHYQRWEEARRDLERASSLWGSRPEVDVPLAEVLIELDQWQAAQERLKPWVNTPSWRPRVLRDLVRTSLMLDDQQGLAEWYEEWQRGGEPRGDDARLAAWALWRLGKDQEARRLLEQFLEKWPGDVPGSELLLQIDASASDTPQRQRLENVIERGKELVGQLPGMQQVAFEQPRNDALRFEIGQILVDRQSREDGLGWLEATVLINPHHRPAREKLIETYRKLEKRHEAKRHQELLEAAARGAL